MPHLDNWSAIGVRKDVYLPPETRNPRLCGTITGHPDFCDGASITTAPIIRTEWGLLTAYTKSPYTLGKVNSDYEEEYPGAYNRLFADPPQRKDGPKRIAVFLATASYAVLTLAGIEVFNPPRGVGLFLCFIMMMVVGAGLGICLTDPDEPWWPSTIPWAD